MPAADFFHLGCAPTLQRLHGRFVTEAGARSFVPPGVTAHPDRPRATQQIRNLLMDPGDRAADFRFLVRGRAGQFTGPSDAVPVPFASTRVTVRPCARRRPGSRRGSGESRVVQPDPGRVEPLPEQFLESLIGLGDRSYELLAPLPPQWLPVRIQGHAVRDEAGCSVEVALAPGVACGAVQRASVSQAVRRCRGWGSWQVPKPTSGVTPVITPPNTQTSVRLMAVTPVSAAG